MDFLYVLTQFAPFVVVGFVAPLAARHLAIKTNKPKQLISHSSTNPLVLEIISLTEVDPDGWTYTRKKAHPTEPDRFYVPSHIHAASNVYVSLTLDGEAVNQIWSPMIVALTKQEKSLLENAFNKMYAERLNQQSLVKMLKER